MLLAQVRDSMQLAAMIPKERQESFAKKLSKRTAPPKPTK